MDKAKPAVADAVAVATHVGFTKAVKFGWLSTDFAESWVVGDLTGADTDTGSALFDQRVDALVAALGEISTFDPGRARH
ncbi:hypothetical protein [Mycolicibacterium canariasense]|uniref:hypothetical protein n=1 Tax=Mycolicibacterium canariasense TaxID=228230 RepID=UPI0032D577A8